MAVVIPYTKQTWTDGVSSCSAARNNVHEDGINDAHYQPAVRVTHNAAQTVTTAVALTLAFNTERFDQAGNVASTQHDNATNNSRLTCRHAGVYQISGSIEWSANPVNTLVEIRLNNTTTIGKDQVVGDQRSHSLTTMYALAVNDFVELRVTQASGSNKDVSVVANTSPEFMMVRVG